MKYILSFALVFTLASCSSADKKKAPGSSPLPTTIAEAAKPDFRTAANRQRDMYRHPVETLSFFWCYSNDDSG